MISPLPDIVIGIALAVGVGLVYKNWKDREMDRINRFYKLQEAKKKEKKMKSDHNAA
ncbi:hypothetical protein PF005_g169 [Phytophthora fragariae]|uniref:Uncharacterized protein n=2 Tax=Phytophthora TaxID=4783 RepID=A0A6A3ZKU0_9STRA|nr:hypothetical protein PF003_g20145 [Phytophthora fragariae]KAE9048509.1 hypothetical protein PR002_g403 [Phytophthora rubi]KAE8950276.1 hypothetical protein PF009_g168 [Phytophthora fragariae]KAE9030466.1 hypothetical protein PF011_g590 [Phytophthora fragariae]KAE9051747.1 hypothetical protein PR001_g1163 [Phytophthora rubi]